ncbi:ISAs1 family transposase, partial [Myceligenerans cantabricum]
LGAWSATRLAVVDGLRVISLDGKTVRGARKPAGRAPHLVAALCGTTTLAQVKVAAKSNEIPAVRDLLDVIDVRGAVLTLDALHTQRDTAAKIRTAGGHYVFTVKANQKTLYQALKDLAWKHVLASTTRETGHGRREARTIKVADRPDWIQFEGAVQVAQLRRTTWRKKSKGSPRKKSVEIVYLIASADHHAAPPATLATWSASTGASRTSSTTCET